MSSHASVRRVLPAVNSVISRAPDRDLQFVLRTEDERALLAR
jgi:hypothetical protein